MKMHESSWPPECSLRFSGVIPHAQFINSFCPGFDESVLERRYTSSYSNVMTNGNDTTT